mgnify:FL=1
MSLVITSSKQQEYNGTAGVGLEKPFSYKNHMKSPLIVKANSEVAVVSVRVDRSGTIVLDEDDRMGIYWGLETSRSTIVGNESDLVSFLELGAGEYTESEFADLLVTKINKLCRDTLSNFSEVKVELLQESDNEYRSFRLTFFQNASATNVSTTLGSGSFTACVNANNDTAPNQLIRSSYGPGPYTRTDDFTVSGNAVTCGSDANKKCVAVMSSTYLSSTSGVCEFDFDNANGNIKIGLVRNIPEVMCCPSRFNDQAQVPNHAGDDGNKIDEFYDYVFTIERSGGKGVPDLYTVGQSLIVQVPGKGDQMAEVMTASYTTGIPNASFDSSKGTYFNKIRFSRFGQEIKIEAVDNSGNASTLIDAGSGALKPVDMGCDLLYAKMEIETAGESIAINRFDVGVPTAHFKSYTTNERLYGFDLVEPLIPGGGSQAFMEQYNRLVGFVTQSSLGYDPNPLEKTPTYENINASGGQKRSWVLCLGPDHQYSTAPLGFEMVPSFDMMRKLGFNHTPLIESVDGVTPGHNSVSFTSNKAPDFEVFENMFIRWRPTQQQSYNAAQGSVSKIIYACPRFDVRGRSAGALYYEPYERVYVDCNNTEDLMITDIGVDIVDVNEMLRKDLVGTSQINFHIRQKEGFKVGRDSGRT